jgi:hypothetical protein
MRTCAQICGVRSTIALCRSWSDGGDGEEQWDVMGERLIVYIFEKKWFRT